jgi:hypothetical protein
VVIQHRLDALLLESARRPPENQPGRSDVTHPDVDTERRFAPPPPAEPLRAARLGPSG